MKIQNKLYPARYIMRAGGVQNKGHLKILADNYILRMW